MMVFCSSPIPLLAAALALLGSSAQAQEGEDSAPNDLRTVAEASGYRKTSSHAEVLAYLDRLQAAGAPIAVRSIGESTGGRELPLVVLSDPPGLSPARAARLDRPVVYLQANIHAGEVAGKEAVLALLRDLTLGPGGSGGPDALLQKLILLVVPDYNPDGNDRFAPVAEHRPGQVGPEQVGLRRNGQDLDLNRDYMKADSVELRAVLEHVFRPWDPDLFIDMHTTDGSYHGYQLTYAPPLQPTPGGGPGEFVRDHLLPALRRAMRTEHGFELFDYGNPTRRGGAARWVTFDYRPRFGTNYAGLRGRMAILSEAYAHAAFRTRVEVSYHFVHEILKLVAANAAKIRSLNRQMDARICAWGSDPASAPELGTAFELVSRGEEDVLMEELEAPPEGSRRPRRSGRMKARKMAICERFEATATTSFPAGFLLPPTMEEAVERLRLHGVLVERLTDPWKGSVEVFTPAVVRMARRPYQGHRMVAALTGGRSVEERELPAGSLWVPTAQPLGLLAFYLLEPTFPDGLLAWGVAGVVPREKKPLPYYRLAAPPVAPMRVLE